jgi:hypothetical protein
LVYFMVTYWGYFSRFGILHHEKSGNPASFSERNLFCIKVIFSTAAS